MAFSTHDQVPDSPTNVFATLNLLDVNSDGLANNINNGNLYSSNPDTEYDQVRTTFYLKTGKWYWEVLALFTSTQQFGVVQKNYAGGNGERRMYQNNALKYSSSSSSYGATFTNGDVIGIFLDLDNGEITFYKNGTTQNVAFTDLLTSIDSVGWTPALIQYNSTAHVNFGQDSSFGGNKTSGSANAQDANGIGSFYYQPPTDALALCTSNLPDPDIDPAVDELPEDHMKAVTYAGNGGTQSIDVGFQPDLIWCKGTNASANHRLHDTVRGVGSTLSSNLTSAEDTTNGLSGTHSDGFSLSSSSNVNQTIDYVAWCFRAGGAPSGSTSTTGSAKRINSSGTQDDTSCSALASAATSAGASNVITPTLMSINQKAGFSIVQFSRSRSSGQTMPHGLTSAPEFMILKEATNSSGPWIVYHKNLSSAANFLYLHDTSSEGSTNAYFNSTHPNSSVFTLGDASTLDSDVICYLWHSVAGYSAFGSYTGNGSTDGPFVYTGFKPAWVMVKRVNAAESWTIFDNARDPYNLVVNRLHPNSADAETTGTTTAGNICLDFYSNSFKLRNTSANINGSELYIYAAFAEMPFRYSATNAR